jgi:hypothetical protein
MSKKFLTIFRAVLLAAFTVALLLPVAAQKQLPPAPKKSSASATCDGALDIVPAKSMSFARKRRPTKSDAKPSTTPADSKTQPKPANGN